MNRLIRRYDLDMIFIAGPGHGGPAVVANTYLEGTYSERYPEISQDADGMRRLFRQFSFPGGIPSHASPERPGSIHEGGELGYSLSHAYGAAFDNPDLLVRCVVGDGEAETGPLATSWHGNKFLNPARDGAVLPILHLNGYKISGPTVLARIGEQELEPSWKGTAIDRFRRRRRSSVGAPHDGRARWKTPSREIREIQATRERRALTSRPRWPVIVLRPPKGWTGPKYVDGKQIEGTFRAHQVPLTSFDEFPERICDAGGMDAELPARGTLRRARAVSKRCAAALPTGRPAHGRESRRQRRCCSARWYCRIFAATASCLRAGMCERGGHSRRSARSAGRDARAT